MGMWQTDTKVAKQNGKCLIRTRWVWCPYYMVKTDPESGAVLGFRCSLFQEDKEGHESLDACNAVYGLTYNGLPHS